MHNVYEEYCTGCGLCHSIHGVEFKSDDKGFLYPKKIHSNVSLFCDEVCPFGKTGVGEYTDKGLWGYYKGVYKGFSLDADIRFKSASGGIITSMAMYLLKTKEVDGVIQIAVSDDCPYHTKVVCSIKEEDVLKNCSSRYCQSSPLMNIVNMVENGKKYVFIGKPCDVTALRNYMKVNAEMKKNIVYLFSFFCAGIPSDRANIELLNKLGCKPAECHSLAYRGNGWPGLTKAIDLFGNERSIEYTVSWMDVLGRDIRKCCKFCFDGIGEKADVSCGDLWCLKPKMEPDFKEREGCNIIFTRSPKGDALIQQMKESNEIYVEDYEKNLYELAYIQPNHKAKRSLILAKIIGLKLCFKNAPKYSFSNMLAYAKHATKRELVSTIRGTVRRILFHKM